MKSNRLNAMRAACGSHYLPAIPKISVASIGTGCGRLAFKAFIDGTSVAGKDKRFGFEALLAFCVALQRSGVPFSCYVDPNVKKHLRDDLVLVYSALLRNDSRFCFGVGGILGSSENFAGGVVITCDETIENQLAAAHRGKNVRFDRLYARGLHIRTALLGPKPVPVVGLSLALAELRAGQWPIRTEERKKITPAKR